MTAYYKAYTYPATLAVKSMKDAAVKLEFLSYLASFSNEIADLVSATEMIKMTLQHVRHVTRVFYRAPSPLKLLAALPVRGRMTYTCGHHGQARSCH